MNPGRFFMPNMMANPMMIRNGFVTNSGIGLLERLSRGVRYFNWGRLLNGANKTLNVMNQTIPLIRQAKPMVGNVKNMLNLAKAFRNETNNSNKKSIDNRIASVNNDNVLLKKETTNDKMPTFFI